MECADNESSLVKTVELDVSDNLQDPEFRLCVYRLTADPGVFVVRVIGPVDSVSVESALGVVEIPSPSAG